MFYVPLYFEVLRVRPVLLFWLVTLAQAVLWIAVPLMFYSAPPGDLVQVLAIGHEFPVDGDFGPPLAYWLAEIAFRAGGLFGVYVLSQICLIATYWCVFTLGRAIVGATHALMAVLLMVGISVFTVPTPDFGPRILAMALWAAVLLFYWRAVIEGSRRYWFALGAAAALMLFTTEAALVLLGPLALFTAMTERGRASLGAVEAWIVLVVLVFAVFAHLHWLERASGATPVLGRWRDAGAVGANAFAWVRLVGVLILAHAGLAVMVVLASGWPRTRASPAPAIARVTVPPMAVTYIKALALVPAVLATIVAVLIGDRTPLGGAAPLLVLSGLAVIVAAGDSIALHHQRILGYAWTGLLLVPALLVPAAIILLPWATGTDLGVAQPAAAMGQFFAESFERRTGHPLAVVGGDTRTAALVALSAPSRPAVYFAFEPVQSRRVTAQDVGEKGAVIVWPAADTNPAPPPEIKTQFPDLVPEVPRTFERSVRGRLPPLLIGWGIIRPAKASAAAGEAPH
jgi:hypothetical protein